MAYFYGLLLLVCSVIDRRSGDGVVSANIEFAAACICLTLAARKDPTNDQH